jgi:hypothetical protein
MTLLSRPAEDLNATPPALSAIFAPLAALRTGSGTRDMRGDAVVDVLHEWLHSPGKNPGPS